MSSPASFSLGMSVSGAKAATMDYLPSPPGIGQVPLTIWSPCLGLTFSLTRSRLQYSEKQMHVPWCDKSVRGAVARREAIAEKPVPLS